MATYATVEGVTVRLYRSRIAGESEEIVTIAFGTENVGCVSSDSRRRRRYPWHAYGPWQVVNGVKRPVHLGSFPPTDDGREAAIRAVVRAYQQTK